MGVAGTTDERGTNIAWRVSKALGLDNVSFRLHPENADDGIIYDVGENGASASGFGHPFCGFGEPQVAAAIGAGSIPAGTP